LNSSCESGDELLQRRAIASAFIGAERLDKIDEFDDPPLIMRISRSLIMSLAICTKHCAEQGRASYCSSVHHEAAACSPNLDARRSQHAAALDGRRKYCRLRPARGCWWQERRALRVCIALSGMGALKIVNLPAEGEAFLEQYA
jgi:hypothetical protein